MKKEDIEEDDANDANDANDAGDANDARPAPKKRARRAAARPEEAPAAAPAEKPRAARKRPIVSPPTTDATAPSAEPDVAAAGVTLVQEKAARRALTTGATLSVVGLMLVGIGPSDAGMAICLAGLIALIYGIHTYGRLGPEPAK